MSWLRFFLPVLAALFAINFGFGSACIDTTDPNEPGECWDHGDCNEMEACKEGWCENIQCLTSSDCFVSEYCDTTDYLCVAGCLESADCPAGDSCDVDTTTCTEDGCIDAIIDCGLGEFCNEDGECGSATDQPECVRCDLGADDACNDGVGICYHQEKDEDDEAYCRWPCDPSDESTCARGFYCQEFENGVFACDAQCGDLTEAGFF
jgi:hypothetical protein